MKNPVMNIGKNIRALRLERGWRQKDLAEKIDCTQKIITAYERSFRFPTAEKIPIIADIFGVTIDELFGTNNSKENRTKKNPRLWKKFEQLEKLPPSEKKSIFKIISMAISKNKRK